MKSDELTSAILALVITASLLPNCQPPIGMKNQAIAAHFQSSRISGHSAGLSEICQYFVLSFGNQNFCRILRLPFRHASAFPCRTRAASLFGLRLRRRVRHAANHFVAAARGFFVAVRFIAAFGDRAHD
ncbi:MAG: hypothetical protein ABR878_09605 [Roseiarcus sp.]